MYTSNRYDLLCGEKNNHFWMSWIDSQTLKKLYTNKPSDRRKHTKMLLYLSKKKLPWTYCHDGCLLACLGTLIHAHRYGIETRLSSITLMRLLFVDCAQCTLTQSKSTSRTIFAISSKFERNPNWNMLIELFDFAISRAVCVYVDVFVCEC